MNWTRLRAGAITTVLVAVLATTLVALSGASMRLAYDGANAALAALVTTVLCAITLIAIIGALIEEWLLARQEREVTGDAIPAILVWLISLYTLLLWLILGPVLYWFGQLIGWTVLTDGYAQPEARLARNALIIAFVLLSFRFLVWRYRAREISAWMVEWVSRRFERRQKQQRGK